MHSASTQETDKNAFVCNQSIKGGGMFHQMARRRKHKYRFQLCTGFSCVQTTNKRGQLHSCSYVTLTPGLFSSFFGARVRYSS